MADENTTWTSTHTAEVRHYDYDNHTMVVDAVVSLRDLGHSLTLDGFTKVLDTFNNGGAGGTVGAGRTVGLNLQHTHRSLQNDAMMFVLGIVQGLSEQPEYNTDPRNAAAVKAAKKIAKMMQDGSLYE